MSRTLRITCDACGKVAWDYADGWTMLQIHTAVPCKDYRGLDSVNHKTENTDACSRECARRLAFGKDNVVSAMGDRREPPST